MSDINDNIDNTDELEGDEFSPNLISVVDDDGTEHVFEELDSMDIDGTEYVALVAVPDTTEDIIDEDGELIILIRNYEGEEIYLEPIEDEDKFMEIGHMFEDRLSDLYEFDDE